MCRGEPVLQSFQIAVHDGFHVGVKCGDDGALVFSEGGIDIGGQRDGDARVVRLDQFACALLVRGVQKREQVADSDCLRAVSDKLCRGTPHRLFVQRDDHLALCGNLLDCLLALRARRKEHRSHRLQHDPVQILAKLVADLQDVLEPHAGDQADLRAFALKHRIGGDRRAVQEAGDAGRGDAKVVRQMRDGVQHRLAGIGARGGDLQRAHRLSDDAADDVGEGAADIDTDFDCWCGHPGPWFLSSIIVKPELTFTVMAGLDPAISRRKGWPGQARP